MSSSDSSDLIHTFPIYVQLPPHPGQDHNRHLLVTVYLLRVGADNVRLETCWNTVDTPINDASTTPRIVVPRRDGVQTFIPREPFDMPIYVIFSRRNRYGTSYHVACALQLREDTAGALEVTVEFLRVRRCNILRSAYIRVVRGGEV
ncbi:hypothetical protein C2E23DRAFT_716240, partial [Lenzites betulinus]